MDINSMNMSCPNCGRKGNLNMNISKLNIIKFTGKRFIMNLIKKRKFKHPKQILRENQFKCIDLTCKNCGVNIGKKMKDLEKLNSMR